MSAKNPPTLDTSGMPDFDKTDKEADFEIMADFERFNQKNDVFRRSWWDANIRSEKSRLFYKTYREPLKSWRKADGFTQKDYAFRNATWHVSDLFTEMKENEDRREGSLTPSRFIVMLQKRRHTLNHQKPPQMKLRISQKDLEPILLALHNMTNAGYIHKNSVT